jgi:hypothetical protein
MGAVLIEVRLEEGHLPGTVYWMNQTQGGDSMRANDHECLLDVRYAWIEETMPV